MKEYSACLLLVALLQVTIAQTINDLSLEYKPLIQQRQSNLGLNIGLSGALIGQTHGAVGSNIDLTIANFTNDLVELDNLVNLSVEEARAGNRNIDACVAVLRANVLALNLREIHACRAIPQLGQAQVKLSELGLFQRDLENALPACLVLSPLDVVQIRACVDGELVRIDNGISAAITDLNSLLDQSSTVGNECVNTRRNQWENQLSVTENDFRACVAAN